MVDQKDLDCYQCGRYGTAKEYTWPFCSERCLTRYYDNAPMQLINKLPTYPNHRDKENDGK